MKGIQFITDLNQNSSSISYFTPFLFTFIIFPSSFGLRNLSNFLFLLVYLSAASVSNQY